MAFNLKFLSGEFSWILWEPLTAFASVVLWNLNIVMVYSTVIVAWLSQDVFTSLFFIAFYRICTMHSSTKLCRYTCIWPYCCTYSFLLFWQFDLKWFAITWSFCTNKCENAIEQTGRIEIRWYQRWECSRFAIQICSVFP